MSSAAETPKEEEKEKENEEQLEQQKKREENKRKAKERADIVIASERKALEVIKEELEVAKGVEKSRAELITRIAKKIEVLPGIPKDQVARIIANGFKRLKVDTYTRVMSIRS